MAYFAMQYQVLFHDTMAYGSHHHTANVKFQNIARETLLFGGRPGGNGDWREQLQDVVMLTREVHSLNLAPVHLGEKVAILLTYEDPTRSTVRLCFRVVRQDGEPVSCGYQSIVLMHKDTGAMVPAPPVFTRHLDPNMAFCLLEPLSAPSFAERIIGGSQRVKEVFPEEIRSIGRHVACADPERSYGRIIDDSFHEYGL